MTSINLCVKRLSRDIKQLLKDPIENIYYKHDEDNILMGYLLIIGPEKTPYYGGYNFFIIKYPENYPFLPPKIKYVCSDGKIRYNPNLYISGKVCLSIINTWQGEGWSSCQNLRSLFITIYSSVFVENPLINEPGITIKNKEVNNYNLLIQYKNIDFLIIDILNKINNNHISFDKNFFKFKDILLQHFINNYNKILENLNDLENKCKDINSITIKTYSIYTELNFTYLKKKLIDSYNNLKYL